MAAVGQAAMASKTNSLTATVLAAPRMPGEICSHTPHSMQRCESMYT